MRPPPERTGGVIDGQPEPVDHGPSRCRARLSDSEHTFNFRPTSPRRGSAASWPLRRRRFARSGFALLESLGQERLQVGIFRLQLQSAAKGLGRFAVLTELCEGTTEQTRYLGFLRI